MRRIMKKILLISTIITLAGCDIPPQATQEEFMLHYDKVKNECNRIVTGEDTLYVCKEPADSMLLKPYHAVKAGGPGSSGWNSGVKAEWADKKFSYETPFKIW